ncbi:MAG: cytochrome c biogenesis protein CcsA [Planctomycetota bacterium]|nr:cytochrome c biogenesis protein CcsA [Planctomycetota bacterium]
MKRTLILTAVALLAVVSKAQETRLERGAPWSDEVLQAVAQLPIQQGGRIKPLDTFAQFELLTFNGKRSFKREWQEGGEKKSETLSAIAWMLDCLFYPDQAWNYEVVVVDDIRAVQAIGLSIEGKDRRDRYSLMELEPAFTRLGELGQELSQKDAADRSGLDKQVLNLARTLPRLRRLLGYLDFARETYDLGELKALAPTFPDRSTATFLDIVKEFDKIRGVLRDDPQLSGVMSSIGMTLQFADYLAFLPPLAEDAEVYESPETVLMQKFQTGQAAPQQWQSLRKIEALMGLRADPARLETGIVDFCAEISRRVEARGENEKIAMEVAFYKADYFYWARVACLIGFLLSMGNWFQIGWHRSAQRGRRMGHRLFFWMALAPTLVGEYMIISGIVTRCLLRDRPPVTTPYEALIFAIACALLVGLFMELIYRNGFAVSLTALFGALGMQVAVWQEATDAVDTMQPLVAVLDTNFWLSTHVTMVVLGYMAAWVAAFIGIFYIGFKFLALFGVWEKTKICHHVSRAAYGVMCFGLVFSLGGTILGGVWANDSWGRFWGWDPKENGALMLVLVFIFILHARMGGYLREFGIALGAIVAGITSFWAFWGVNLLQIGLHSYGFDEHKAHAWMLVRYCGWTAVGFGVLVWGLHRLKAARAV